MPAFPVSSYYVPILSSQALLAKGFFFCEDREVMETANLEKLVPLFSTFHRGHLRPLETIGVYIMIHNSSKITIMKYQ